MRTLLLVLLLAAAGTAVIAAEVNPVRTHPHGAAPAAAPQRYIIKLRPATGSAVERVAALTARNGVHLVQHRPITAALHALQLEPATAPRAAEVLARLRADPEVEFADPDVRQYIHGAPNDPLYAQQWYLQIAAATPSAVDAIDAWSTTTGSTTLVIADIDTGVRSDHPDLTGKLLPGYCFITDAFVANGGACPGPGADDPGDWITSSDVASNADCSGQMAAPSSWHGTRVAGTLGAVTNNGVGIAGLSWGSQILPVRALGKCGGLESDIIRAMLWAGGVAVSGAPANPNPAKIINMSLGSVESCPSTYIEAIGQLNALGVLVVASAGNEGGPVDAPADCAGVAGVAGLRQAGTKVGFSSLGTEVALGAPAGNCGDGFTTAESPCVYSIMSTTNLSAMGPQTPDASDYTGLYYCDSTTGSYAGCTIGAGQYRTYSIGTSFSAPVVAGIAALMSSVNKNLNSCQLIARLKEGSQPYPQSSLDATGAQPPMCHVPTSATDLQTSECICTRDDQTCGAGMANAPGALAAALRPIAAVAVPASVTAGQTVTLDASGSGAANGHNVTGYQWTSVGGAGLMLSITGATSSKATLTGPSCGVGTVAVTVTDDAGHTDTANVVVTSTSASTAAPAAAAGQSACSTSAPAVLVGVCPGSASLQTGATVTLTATLANTTDTNVTWQVNGIPGGNATIGTITSAGVYSAPAAVPPGSTVTITAVSAADTSAQANSQLTITAPPGSGGGGGGGGLDPATLLAGAALLAARLFRRRLAGADQTGCARDCGRTPILARTG